jgi:hypothetical protein
MFTYDRKSRAGDDTNRSVYHPNSQTLFGMVVGGEILAHPVMLDTDSIHSPTSGFR